MSTGQEASTHPSYLGLDRLSLGSAAARVTEHVAGCEQCQRYLRTLSETPPASGFVAIRAGIAQRRRRSLRAWAAGGSVLAAAACLVLAFGVLGRPAPHEPGPTYVGAKGFASVWIYVKRGSTTLLWDGKRPIFSGDRLRIKLDPASYRQIMVYSVNDPQAPELLYSGGVVPGQSSSLPDAWEVDAEPGAERLLVVLSSEPVQPALEKWLKGEASAGVSLHSFVLPKSSSPRPDASMGGP